MTQFPNEILLSAALLLIGAYFTWQIAHSLLQWIRFVRLRGTSLVTWPARPSPMYGLSVMLGIVAAGLTILSLLRGAYLHRTYSQAVMAVYFLGMLPLLRRIRPGLYEDGIWCDGGFVPYRDVGRWAFREQPELRLMILTHGSNVASNVAVPPEEYGTVRKILEQKARDRAVRLDPKPIDLS
jgi:hypothetical protein